ncbi:membrane protease YdiL (CAAX protease family) [Thermosporothrix hazakensis]|jgi:membrane protease YdiL (CAAX protease family)|uniref:Membrane protease YdiL (CAAX protease family) n=1 Tax=Thermosporothrix hazakensis TaxID=644383 RepID=A0A326U5S1_THEHA|nr:CPBP family intramembrane glutamic endopeptidase [Thermosporothrix hazakensis]PZW29291.1 membrane protease YdiL (CAAX protease family) [Thermosporothrix hazakensis]GCE45356.1 hypothetical protein KTH_02250 [Thermosporothrix hazakensis]
MDEPQKQIQSKQQPWRWKDIGFIFLAAFVLILVLEGTLWELLPPDTPLHAVRVYVRLLITGCSLIGAVCLVDHVRTQIVWGRGVSWRGFGLALGLALALRLLSVLFVLLIHLLEIQLHLPLQTRHLQPYLLSWHGMIALAFLVGILTPFAEELLFRGVLYTFLRQRWKLALSTGVNSAIYAVLHTDPSVIPLIFLLGVCCSLLYEYSRRLWLPILLHSFYNLSGLLILFSTTIEREQFPALP